MLQLTYPGVYTQEQPSGVRTIAGAPTSVALFVGPTRSGIDRRAILCLNFSDFERNFGGLSAKSSLSHSVLHFFANGGGQAYVIRVPASGAVAAKSGLQRDGANTVSITLTALGSGAAGNSIFVAVDPFEIGAQPFTSSADQKRFTLTLTDALTGRVERFANLTTAAGNARTADAVVNDRDTGSRLVSLKLDGLDAPGPQATGSIYRITTAPTAGTFGDDVKLRLSVNRRKADGSPDTANSISNLAVTVFPKNAVQPVSPLELVTRLVTALNDALRAQPDADVKKLGGATVEGAVFEGGTLLRLQLSPPTGAVGTERFHDATVTITAPASGTSFLTTYGIDSTGLPTNPSRYQLGAVYASSQITGPVAGIDGAVHGQPDSTVFKTAVSDLDTPRPVLQPALPARHRAALDHRPQGAPSRQPAAVYAEAARVCGNKFAFLVVDPPPNAVDVGSAAAWKSTKIGFASPHAGAWFPNMRVDDPLEAGAIMSHPPSGAIAGVIARTDAQVGRLAGARRHGRLPGRRLRPVGRAVRRGAGAAQPNRAQRDPAVPDLPDGRVRLAHRRRRERAGQRVEVHPGAAHRQLHPALAVGRAALGGAQAQRRRPVDAAAGQLHRLHAGAVPAGRVQGHVAAAGLLRGLRRLDHHRRPTSTRASSTSSIGFSPLKPAEFVVITLRQIVQPAA